MGEERPDEPLSSRGPDPRADDRTLDGSVGRSERHALLEDAEEGAREGWVRHDFERADQDLSPSRIARLRASHAEFSRSVAERLATLLSLEVRLETPLVEATSYTEILRGLPEPASLHLVWARGIGASFLLGITPQTLLGMIECLLGGPPGGEPPPERPLTALEASLGRAILRRILESFDEVWRIDEPLGLEVLASERNPRLLEIEHPGGRVVHLRSGIELEKREGARGCLELIVPRGPLLDVMASGSRVALSEGATDGRERDRGDRRRAFRRRILENLGVLSLEVAAGLTTRPLPLRALLALEPGDAIDTGIPIDTLVEVSIDDRRVAGARAGEHEGRLAVRLEGGRGD